MAYDSDRRLNYLDDEVTSRLGAYSLIQRGTIVVDTALTTTGTATITSVNVNRARLSYLGHSLGANTAVDTRARLTFTNATTITANCETGSATGTITVGYQVEEYAA